ncbi:hypothetical protein [Cellulosimicrobium sp. 22601]|uniref:hypothetical protein n=1 Tax=unclassified Cellulosimicrobium TaxID=2624466 RepID=UPI003F841A2B
MSYDSTARESFDDDVTALLDYEHAVTDVLALVGRARRTSGTYQRGHEGRGVLVARLVSDAGRWAVRIFDEHPSVSMVAALLPLDPDLDDEPFDAVLVDADHALIAADYHRTTVWDDAGERGGLPLALVEPLPDLAPPPWAHRSDVLPLDHEGGALVTFERSIGTRGDVGVYVDAEVVVTADGHISSGPRVIIADEQDAMSPADARELATRLLAAADIAEAEDER